MAKRLDRLLDKYALIQTRHLEKPFHVQDSDSSSNSSDRESVFMAVGFCSANFALNAQQLSEAELIDSLLAQLDRVFSNLKVIAT